MCGHIKVSCSNVCVSATHTLIKPSSLTACQICRQTHSHEPIPRNICMDVLTCVRVCDVLELMFSTWPIVVECTRLCVRVSPVHTRFAQQPTRRDSHSNRFGGVVWRTLLCVGRWMCVRVRVHFPGTETALAGPFVINAFSRSGRRGPLRCSHLVSGIAYKYNCAPSVCGCAVRCYMMWHRR